MPNLRFKRMMLEAVDSQLRDNEPICVPETYERLINLGYSEKQAKEMIAAVLVEEMYYVLKDKRKFDEESYRTKLNELGVKRFLGDEESDTNIDEDELGEEDTNMIPFTKDFQIGRNDPCPCGSGKKYKKCCGK